MANLPYENWPGTDFRAPPEGASAQTFASRAARHPMFFFAPGNGAPRTCIPCVAQLCRIPGRETAPRAWRHARVLGDTHPGAPFPDVRFVRAVVRRGACTNHPPARRRFRELGGVYAPEGRAAPIQKRRVRTWFCVHVAVTSRRRSAGPRARGRSKVRCTRPPGCARRGATRLARRASVAPKSPRMRRVPTSAAGVC
jgi:hypothetical protein